MKILLIFAAVKLFFFNKGEIMGKVVFKYVFILLFVATCSISLSSCGNGEDSTNNLSENISGKWKLLKCNSNICTWDEYVEISGNTMSWKKGKSGHDSRYNLNFDESGSSFSAKCSYASNGKYNDMKFVVTDCSMVSLAIVDAEGNTRVFAKDLSNKMVTENTEMLHLAELFD